MEFQKLKGKIHYVFDSPEEFKHYSLQEWGKTPPIVDNWRTAKEGDWVLADDGGVVQILRWGRMVHPGDRKNYKTHNGYVRTIVGTFPQNHREKMDTDFSKHVNRYRFGGIPDGQKERNRKDRTKVSNPERVFVAALCSGKRLQAAYEEAFGPHVKWYQKALFLLKRERIMSAIKEDVKDTLDQKFGGNVLDFIFDELKKLILTTESDGVKLAALKDLGEWSGEKEKTKQITRGEVRVFEPFAKGELARIEAEEVKVLAEVDG